MHRREFFKIAGKRGLFIASGGLSLVGCSPTIFEPEWVSYHKIDPLPEFRDWWNEINACSDLPGKFERIQWFRVNEESIPCFIEGKMQNCVDIWKRPHDIYLPDVVFTMYNHGSWTDSYQRVRKIVKHGMLHDLLQSGKHPSIFEKCGVMLG